MGKFKKCRRKTIRKFRGGALPTNDKTKPERDVIIAKTDDVKREYHQKKTKIFTHLTISI